MKKKSQLEFTTIGAMILAIVGMIMGYQLVKNYSSSAVELIDRHICKQSVEYQSINLKTIKPSSSIIDCPIAYLEFSKDKLEYEYRGKKKNYKIPDGEKKEPAIKKRIANEIYQCWDQFHEGKKDLFGGARKYCHVCSVITFKETEQPIYGFNTYLMANTVPDKELAEKGVTYFDYLQGYTKKNMYDQAAINANAKAIDESIIDPAKAYTVVFVYAKSEPLIENSIMHISNFLGTTSGKVAVVGGVILIAGGAAVSLSGVGAPGGIALIAAGASLIRYVTFEAAAAGVAEAYTKAEPVRDWFAFVVFGEFHEETLRGLGCEELPVNMA